MCNPPSFGCTETIHKVPRKQTFVWMTALASRDGFHVRLTPAGWNAVKYHTVLHHGDDWYSKDYLVWSPAEIKEIQECEYRRKQSVWFSHLKILSMQILSMPSIWAEVSERRKQHRCKEIKQRVRQRKQERPWSSAKESTESESLNGEMITTWGDTNYCSSGNSHINTGGGMKRKKTRVISSGNKTGGSEVKSERRESQGGSWHSTFQ